MRKNIFILRFSLLLAVASPVWAGRVYSLPETADYVPGGILVRFKSQASEGDQQNAFSTMGRGERVSGTHFHKVRLNPGLPVEEAVTRMFGHHAVEWAPPH